jgi:hypothetical protein
VVNWIGDTTSLYTVTRAVFDGTAAGDYVAITGTPVKDDKSLAADNNSVVYHLIDTTAAYRTTYVYKVVGTSSDGLISTASGIGTNYQSKTPYTSVGTVSLISNPTATAGSKQIEFRIGEETTPDANLYTGETVRIYYWPVENNLALDTSAFVEFSKANAESATAGDRLKTATGLRANTSYAWQAYIYSGGKNFEVSGTYTPVLVTP